MLILAIESSCDETSIALVSNGCSVSSVVTASSSNLFYETGGVVPEVAARAQTEYILPVFEKCLTQAHIKVEDIDYIAVTVGPGLVGSLFVGITFAKTLSLITGKPIIPVNHLLGHIFSIFIKDYLSEIIQTKDIEFPALALVVSGGHTDLVLLSTPTELRYLGGTRDDAVGESFDKVARILGIDRYLGGAKLSKIAAEFKDVKNLKLPRPMIDSDTLEFSFSGLKTAVLSVKDSFSVEEIANEFEKAVCDTLLYKTKKAFDRHKPKSVILCGGVSANTTLRELFIKNFENVFIPPFVLCTDNASMIGAAAFYYKHLKTNDFSKINADPSLSLQNLY